MEELPDLIRRFHDGDKKLQRELEKSAAARGARRESHNHSARCVWPRAALEALTGAVVGTVRLRPKRRATLEEVLPELERLAAMRA